MKVLVLSCSTGGGHNSCARYITEEFNDNNIECHFKDYLELIGEKRASLVEKLYLDSTRGNGNVFRGVYKLGELYNKSNITSPVYLMNKLAKDKLYNYIKDNNYDLIICTHLFPSMALTAIKKDCNIRFINVATDYECIPFWNETKPDYFVIPSKLLKDDFIKKGVREDILLPLGIPVSSNFKNNIKDIKIKTDKDIVLLTSGSMGFGKMKELVNTLITEFSNIYFIVVCGNNEKLEKELLKIKCDNLKVIGFTKDMNAYMNLSKVVITKPGGLTTSEVATLNKPLIHMMPIPGVENYNATFYEKNKMSLKAINIEEVVSKLRELLDNKKLQEELTSNQRRIINGNSASDLVKFVKEKYE